MYVSGALDTSHVGVSGTVNSGLSFDVPLLNLRCHYQVSPDIALCIVIDHKMLFV